MKRKGIFFYSTYFSEITQNDEISLLFWKKANKKNICILLQKRENISNFALKMYIWTVEAITRYEM